MTTKLSDWGAPIVSGASILLFGGSVFALMFHTIPPGNEPVVLTSIGLLGAWAASSVHYWTGNTTSGDDANDAITAKMNAPHAPTTVVVDGGSAVIPSVKGGVVVADPLVVNPTLPT